MAVAWGLACGVPGAQAQVLRNVALVGEADDALGQRLVYLVREGLRKSAGLRYQESQAQAGMVLRLSTLQSIKDLSTGYAAVWTVGPNEVYASHGVGLCLRDTMAACAETLVAQTDSLREKLAR